MHTGIWKYIPPLRKNRDFYCFSIVYPCTMRTQLQEKPWVFKIQNLSSLLLSHKGYRLDATWSHKFSEFLFSISADKPNCVCQKLCSLKLNLWWVVLHIKLTEFKIFYRLGFWETPPSSLHAWSKSPPLTTMYLSTTKYIDNDGNLYYHQNTCIEACAWKSSTYTCIWPAYHEWHNKWVKWAVADLYLTYYFLWVFIHMHGLLGLVQQACLFASIMYPSFFDLDVECQRKDMLAVVF